MRPKEGKSKVSGELSFDLDKGVGLGYRMTILCDKCAHIAV